ncbi:TPA: hypothetical protein TUD77_001570 [Streptococcus equi subsp. zooepidemicus]|uniref:hypothetical protein n=1 Tax=Streptococcus equi TaxID=1336 RepID=UPI0005BC5CAD|nr:hypothetical protein [Streptococcus equi]KIS11560.1 hypothetical protein AT51_00473 [Streptococcus equi subsp. zooepidemicus Sz57]MCD3375751.1 HK97 family phage prohead protease [Streptococcus equi subsp. zooepidemicus]MCD3437968.1 HK97 family phage prohead protease [Streptococcus equi subsp. zooepidemicus]HEL0065888.1 hypothetical protein [Streptococcus equi subsp. zooepidemicus]HEL0074069.1 hypothetical protein [Streptococcus equi subsp. zooepidemicus]
MEKQPKHQFTGLKSLENLKDIYRQTYLELEAGDIVELSHFQNFDMDWNQLINSGTFEAIHNLGEDRKLRYTCQLENSTEARDLFNQISERTDEDSSRIISELLRQTAKIIAVDISKQNN